MSDNKSKFGSFIFQRFQMSSSAVSGPDDGFVLRRPASGKGMTNVSGISVSLSEALADSDELLDESN